MGDPPPVRATFAWSPLRQSLFRGIWIATIVSNIGSWMQDVGAGRRPGVGISQDYPGLPSRRGRDTTGQWRTAYSANAADQQTPAPTTVAP